jgi:hypothetical protein
VEDITLKDRELMAGSTPSVADLLGSWAVIYRAAIDNDRKALAFAISSHAKLHGYAKESAMRSNRERINATLQKVSTMPGGWELALRRVVECAIDAGKRA